MGLRLSHGSHSAERSKKPHSAGRWQGVPYSCRSHRYCRIQKAHTHRLATASCSSLRCWMAFSSADIWGAIPTTRLLNSV